MSESTECLEVYKSTPLLQMTIGVYTFTTDYCRSTASTTISGFVDELEAICAYEESRSCFFQNSTASLILLSSLSVGAAQRASIGLQITLNHHDGRTI